MNGRKKLIIVLTVLAIVVGGGVGVGRYMLRQESEQTVATEQTNPEPQPVMPPETELPAQEPTTSSVDKNQNSIDDPDSIWIIVNKQRPPLPSDFRPEGLRAPNVRLRLAASEQQMQIGGRIIPEIEAMFAAAANDGVQLVFGSGYRSYALQKQFYDSYVTRDGQAAADRYSARPGTSEHQTGLAFDVTSPSGRCHLEICFENLPEGQWVAQNAHKFGFIIRYPNGKEHITGYQYEPWHLRYVGKELAEELYRSGQTMEEFFGLI
jgi:zinc D-Ala-D-Ala carboxypeptidase